MNLPSSLAMTTTTTTRMRMEKVKETARMEPKTERMPVRMVKTEIVIPRAFALSKLKSGKGNELLDLWMRMVISTLPRRKILKMKASRTQGLGWRRDRRLQGIAPRPGVG